LPWFEYQKRFQALLYTLISCHAKSDKYQENDAKTMRNRDEIWRKKSDKSHFGYKFTAKFTGIMS